MMALTYLYLPAKYLHLCMVGRMGFWEVAGFKDEERRRSTQIPFILKVFQHPLLPLESRAHANLIALCAPGESDMGRKKGGEPTCPPHPHTIFPFKNLSSHLFSLPCILTLRDSVSNSSPTQAKKHPPGDSLVFVIY